MIQWHSPNQEPFPTFGFALFHRPGTIDGDTLQATILEDEYEARPHIQPGDTVVDLGAYIGGFSALALSMGAFVHAVEPIGENCRMVLANTATWRDCFSLTRAALSSDPGPIEIRALTSSGGPHAFMGVTAGSEAETTLIESVPTVTLNEIIDPLLIVSFLKCDCEGGEWDSFRDLTPDNLAKIERIAIEIHPRNGESIEQAQAKMRGLLSGFRLTKTHLLDMYFERE